MQIEEKNASNRIKKKGAGARILKLFIRYMKKSYSKRLTNTASNLNKNANADYAH